MSSAPEKNRLQREIWGVVICLVALLITLRLPLWSSAICLAIAMPSPVPFSFVV